MSFTTTCPSCGSVLRLEDDFAGLQAQCGQCGAVFTASPGVERRKRVSRGNAEPRVDGSGYAVTSFVLGLANVALWCCPFVGVITAGIGFVLGMMGLQSRSRSLAIMGMILSTIAMIFALGFSVVIGIAAVREDAVRTMPTNGNDSPFFPPR